jgi:nucleotide-binding universal stress UspA family protein
MGTMERVHDRIVVGVDGSAASRNAVLWAAGEARSRRSDLIITHVEQRSSASSQAASLHALLAGSAEAASRRAPAVAVGTLLLHPALNKSGAITDALIDLSRSAILLVVGFDPTKPRSAYGALGSDGDRVAAQTACPVVMVATPPRIGVQPEPEIVVGWTNDLPGHRALAAAAAEAIVGGATLAVRVIGQRALGSRGTPDAGDEQLSASKALLADLARDHPTLRIGAGPSAIDTVSALTARAAAAVMLVVGCQRSEDQGSIRAGSLTGEVMRQAVCPVMLVGGLVRTRRGFPPLPVAAGMVSG